MSKVVIALGGNALGNTFTEQREAIKKTVSVIADLVEIGHQIAITHGNGPQVGMIDVAMQNLASVKQSGSSFPLSACGAMSQGYIGSDLQNCMREELLTRGITKEVDYVLTQVCISASDPAFAHPSKPIGAFLTAAEAEELKKQGQEVIEDSGRGYRRVVPSPKPIDIVEKNSIKALLDQGHVVISCGGGGIPVIKKGNRLMAVDAVIDKDLASAKLASLIDADYLVILTAVEKVAINFGKDNEQWLSSMTVDDAMKYILEGQFALGSMLPKVEAAIDFASAKPRNRTLITLLEKAKEGLNGDTGTMITSC